MCAPKGNGFMKLAKVRSVLTASVLMMIAGGVLAAPPAALDRVPAGAPVKIAIRDLEHASTKLSDYAKMLNAPMEDGENPIEKARALMVLTGVNKSGSMAMAMLEVPKEEDAMDAGDEGKKFVLVVPVLNAGEFLKALKGEGDGSVKKVRFDDNDAYARDIGGGYVAVGPSQSVMESFEGKAGSMPAIEKSLGAAGRRTADAADLLVVVDAEAFRDKMTESVQGMKENADAQLGMLGPAAENAEAGVALMQAAAEGIVRDSQTMVFGIGLTDKGVWFDLGGQFKEGSELAATFAEQGKTGSLVSNLPKGNFLVAGSVDVSNPAVKSIMKAIVAASPNKENAEIGGGMKRFAAMAEKSDGMAFEVGTTPALLGGGLLNNASTYIRTSDPQSHLTAAKDAIAGMNGKEINGVKMTTEYKPGAVEIAGTKVDTWTTTAEVNQDDPNAMQIQQAQMMLYGNGPIGGMSAAISSGVVSTMSQNTALMTAAIEAAKSGKGLTEDALLAATMAQLPENRMAEFYIGTKGVLDSVGGILAMMGGADAPPTPKQLSPVAIAFSNEAGGMSLRVVIPSDVMVAVKDFGEAVKKAQQGGADEEEPAKKGDSKSGAPQF